MSFFDFQSVRRGIIDTIKENPDEIPGILQRTCDVPDEEVQFTMDCLQRSIRPLVDFRIAWKESPSVVECGGRQFVLTQTDVEKVFLEQDRQGSTRAKLLISKQPALLSCHCSCVNSEKLRYFCMDPFTARTIVRYIVQDIFTEAKFPHCSTLHYAYLDGQHGYTLYDMIDIGSFQDLLRHEKLTVDTVKKIITQLVVIFHHLAKYSYSHGTASSQSLLFRRDISIDYEYEGLKVQSDLVIQLSDMWHSSITYYGNHFYEKGDSAHVPFQAHIEQKRVAPAYCDMNHIRDLSVPLMCPAGDECPQKSDYEICSDKDILFYTMTGSTFDVYREIRNLGVPIFTGSFDFYCIMTSLMCNKEFYTVVKNSDELQRLWLLMWLGDDYVAIEKELIVQHQRDEKLILRETKERQAVNIIRKRYLRCDILDFMIGVLRDMNIE